ncbi:neuropilin-1a-like [Salvelinus alpinus]
MHCGLVLFLLMGIFFVAKAFKNDKCGDNIRITNANYLTSPGYPTSYLPSQKCVWVITAPGPHQRILINFNPHFDLEDRECKYDYVEVRDGVDENGQLVGKYCGKIAPSPVVSSGNQLYIKFVSDYETHGAGFSIRYEIFKTGPECSRNLTSNSGVIKSPGFPEKYPNNLDCTFMIFSPKMSEIILEFESFELEPDTTPPTGVFCRYDRLEIWDGFPGVGPYIGRYCGQNTPGRIISYTGILALIINTDSAIAKEGFSANFTVLERTVPEDFDCTDPLGMESGEIASEQIVASSQYNPGWSPERARLNYYENAWTPGEDNNKEWIQVDLGFLRFVTAVGTQGAVSQETKKTYWVKSYKVDVSSNGEDWITLKEGSKQKASRSRQTGRLPQCGTTMPEAMTDVDTIPAFLWFACDFGWANDPSFCGWTSEDSGFRWQIQSSGTPTLNTGPNMDHTGGSGNFIYTLATGAQETEVARLVSPVVTVGQSDLCVSFWYHMFGSHIGTLHIKQRKETVDGMADILLWTVSGHQGNRWREGRVLVPHSSKPYQVVIEGLVERKSWGDIAVDDIKILDNLNMADCKDPDVPTEPMLPEDRFNEIIVDITDFPEIVENNEILNGVSGGAGNMLKTLDPILITIIAMSALGVFLGAICGVVLYCACSHGHMSDRNLSALENYNFELVDGVKLKKDKLNSQNSYTEA